MRERDDGGPAFPFKVQGPTTAPEAYYGMSLRDYAVIEFVSAQIKWEGMEGSDKSQTLAMAHELADEFIAWRKKP